MSYIDLLRMSLSSLRRRKLRTVLTVLGVVVGTASIVVMISLGLGLNKSSMEQIEQYGGLTTITVYPSENGYSYTSVSGGGVMVESAGSGDKNSKNADQKKAEAEELAKDYQLSRAIDLVKALGLYNEGLEDKRK